MSSSLSNALSILAPQTSTTGTSSFAADLQASVNRALEIAALPMQALEQDQSTISGETSELSTLGGLFNSLQTSLQGINTGTGSNTLQATVGTPSVITAAVTGNALAGTYTVQVLDAGTSSSSMSNSATPVTDPTSQNISASTSFTLTVGTSTYTVAGDNLNDLASAINSSGAPVQAVIVNLGSPEAPNYQLSLQSTALGDVALQLNDGTSDLLTSLHTGTDASYTVDGQPPAGISSDSSTVTIAPGLNVTLNALGTSTVTVASSLNSISTELSSFVTAYNSAFSELQKNFGQNGGALTGDSAVLDMQQAMQQMISYAGSSGSITSLTQLGVEFTQQGTLTFDPTAMSGLSQSQISDALTFLGGTTTGGFLQYADNSLTGITDPISGSIATETQSLQNQNTQDQTQITNDQEQLTLMQTNLNAQMAQANALIATLQNQTSFLQGLFQADTSNNPNASTTG
ncbi:MAG TPA: flagellar filament capping protein FliD [Bryobacteraceae bacterium]|jgi:flagellar hook-associated protein 2|nr:flagellar filament capping protein FliD [Bryobacteraceae bacterium]